MKVTIDKATLLSIHSISVGASKDDVAPVITQIALMREGDALRAMATDRYMIVAGRYTKNIVFEDWEDGATMLIDPKALKNVVDIKKAEKYGTMPVDIVKDAETGHVSAVVDTVTHIHLGSLNATFPPVLKLFPEGEPTGATALSLKPDFLARLTKVLPPELKPSRERVWDFQFRSIEGHASKPQPVLASYSGEDHYKLEALIQPNLRSR